MHIEQLDTQLLVSCFNTYKFFVDSAGDMIVGLEFGKSDPHQGISKVLEAHIDQEQ